VLFLSLPIVRRPVYPDAMPATETAELSAEEIREALADAMRENGVICLPPAGRSMGRAFERVDAILVEPAPAAPLPIGTVVVFEMAGSWVAHRVVWKRREAGRTVYLTKGDAMRRADPGARTHADLIGCVTAIVAGGATVPLAAPRARLRAFLSLARALPGALPFFSRRRS